MADEPIFCLICLILFCCYYRRRTSYKCCSSSDWTSYNSTVSLLLEKPLLWS